MIREVRQYAGVRDPAQTADHDAAKIACSDQVVNRGATHLQHLGRFLDREYNRMLLGWHWPGRFTDTLWRRGMGEQSGESQPLVERQ
ncbi:hypothetical protein KRMM14A1004_56430 [Krasilnikovia sp. MM14-A1004]